MKAALEDITSVNESQSGIPVTEDNELEFGGCVVSDS